VRFVSFFVVGICAHVSDVGVSEANNLSGITWVGENFLVSSEAGIKNDFPAPAGFGSRCAAVKNSPVFKRKRRGLSRFIRQRSLLNLIRKIVYRVHFGGGAAEIEPKWLIGQ
jgi:hypothetical protein